MNRYSNVNSVCNVYGTLVPRKKQFKEIYIRRVLKNWAFDAIQFWTIIIFC